MLLRIVLLLLVLAVVPVRGEPTVSGQVLKVLPHYLDAKGRTSTAPSLYERDAYQAQLRANPALRSGMEFSVKWRATAPKDTPLKLRLELRGGRPGQLPTRATMEQTLTPGGGLFGIWTPFRLEGVLARHLGDVNSWRATLWQGERLLSEQKSFLWAPDPVVVATGTNSPSVSPSGSAAK